jgi:hypothetical protein
MSDEKIGNRSVAGAMSVRAALQGPFVLCILLAFLASPAVGAAATMNQHGFEVSEYRKDFDVSSARAERSLEVQDKGADLEIADKVEDALGDAYAGIWFDNHSAEYVVPLLPQASQGSLSADLSGAGLAAGEFRTASAESTWSELEAAQSQINGELGSMFAARVVETSLSPASNSVVIRHTQAVGAIGRSQIERVAAEAPVNVKIDDLPIDRFDSELEACNGVFCGNPLRGGVRIYNPSYPADSCTAGFKAVGNADGKRYLLTAGHCVELPGDQSGTEFPLTTPHWASKDETLTQRYIGKSVQWTYANSNTGDWAKIDVSGSWWDVPSWPGEVAYWGPPTLSSHGQITGQHPPISPDYRINGAGTNVSGSYACHSGQVSGTTCGTIGNLNVSFTTAGRTMHGLVQLVGICSEHGDSGGSVFWNNKALGLWHNSYNSFACNDTGLYVDINRATQDLNVHIPTPPTGPVSWHYDTTPGGTLTSKPAIASSESDRLELFARGTNGTLWRRHWNGVNWDPWQDLGGQLSSGPSAVSWGPGRTDVVFLTPTGSIEHRYWVNNGWHADNLGGQWLSDPAVSSWGPGRLDVFARATEPLGEGLWHRWWSDVHGWSAWEPMGGGQIASGPAAVSWDRGRIDVVAVRKSDSSLQHWYWQDNVNSWTTDNLGGTFASEPALASWGPGRLDVFARGKTSNKLWHKWWTNPGGYSAWEDMGGSLTSGISAVSWYENRIDVVGRTGAGNTTAHWWWGG